MKWSENRLVVSDSLYPMDYTAHGILQARILEWVSFPFSKGSSQPRDQTLASRIAGGFFTSWATREARSRIKLKYLWGFPWIPDRRNCFLLDIVSNLLLWNMWLTVLKTQDKKHHIHTAKFLEGKLLIHTSLLHLEEHWTKYSFTQNVFNSYKTHVGFISTYKDPGAKDKILPFAKLTLEEETQICK